MTDYIDREAILALIDDWELQLEDDEIYFEYIDPKKVRVLPAADVRPVVKAHWEDVDVSFIDSKNTVGLHAIASMFCPVCERYHNEVYWYGEPTDGVNYCPNCGADMRGAE